MKKIFSFLLILVCILATSCTDTKNNSSNTNDENNDKTISIKDQIGREVTLEAPAKRIVSGYYSSTTLCLVLGLKDNLVAIEKKLKLEPYIKKRQKNY